MNGEGGSEKKQLKRKDDESLGLPMDLGALTRLKKSDESSTRSRAGLTQPSSMALLPAWRLSVCLSQRHELSSRTFLHEHEKYYGSASEAFSLHVEKLS